MRLAGGHRQGAARVIMGSGRPARRDQRGQACKPDDKLGNHCRDKAGIGLAVETKAQEPGRAKGEKHGTGQHGRGQGESAR
jgi:hypothetical protein